MIGALAGAGIGVFREVSGPMLSQSLADFRTAVGWNDIAQGRAVTYRQQFDSTVRRLNDNFTPIRFNLSQAIQQFNQGPWGRADADADLRRRLWNKLRSDLRWNGVDIGLQALFGGQGATGALDTPQATAWYRLIDMSSAAAPLSQVIHDYLRSEPLPAAERTVDERELRFNLQRAEFRRKEDRERLMNPFYKWSLADATRLWWMGLLDGATYSSLVSAAGVRQGRDASYLDQLQRLLPSSDQLLQWAGRRLWDEDVARRWQLDNNLDESPLAKFFAERQGVGYPVPRLPHQPPGTDDWLKLSWRALRPMPDFHMSRVLQFRLRPSPVAEGESVVPGSPPWSADDTREMLRLSGYSDPIIQRMMGVVHEPLNIRLINHILGPYSTHPEVRAEAARAFGPGADWVKMAMLDHGFSEPYAAVAAKGVYAQADDRDNAEKKQNEKALRAESRALALSEYRAGTLLAEDAGAAIRDDYFTLDMAREAIAMADREIHLGIVTAQIKAVKEGYFSGRLGVVQITQLLTNLGIVEIRRNQYISEWTWERTEKQRTLTTGEILAALKAGMMTPQEANMRLVNLGWIGSDAMLEVAMVEREIAATTAKLQATSLLRAEKEQTAAAKATLTAAAKTAAAQAKALKAAKKLTVQQVLALHQKLLNESSYFATVHLDNDAYNKAAAKGDEEKMQAELAKEVAAYQQWLIKQISLAAQSPEVSLEVGPIDTEPAPGPSPGQGNGKPKAPPDKSSPAAGSPNSGAGAPTVA